MILLSLNCNKKIIIQLTPDKLNLEAGEIEKSLSYREFELSRVKYCYIENDPKGNENCFELAEGSS